MPIVVGGTGLYVKALLGGFDFGGTNKDENLRSQLETLAEEKGNDYLFEKLKEKNPQMAQKTDKLNTVRLVRALEIALSGGEKGKSESDIEACVIALNRDRQKLYDDINRRVDTMLERGLVEEVENLKKCGISSKNQAMKAIGYKEVLSYLDGEIDFDRMKELIKQHSRNYAKRQLTFLRGMDDVSYIDTEDKEKAYQQIMELVKNFLES